MAGVLLSAGERPRWLAWLVSVPGRDPGGLHGWCPLVLGYNRSSADWQFSAFFGCFFFLLFYDSFQQKGEKKASFCRIILP